MATGRSDRGYRRSFGDFPARNNFRQFKNCPTACFIPGSDVRPEEVFTYPFLVDKKTIEYFTKCKKVMFIIRGFSGTGKTTLSAMIDTKYPAGVICSADSYFSQAFVDKSRSKENLKESHQFCQRRVKQECQKSTHPIIVQNTHVRRWELAPYIDLAAEYGYNVILVVTHRKFKVSAQILAQTNKKGLKEEYFQIRLNQWQECIPAYTGWFFGHEDTKFIVMQVRFGLKYLLEDSKFCRVMNAFTEDEIWNKYFVEDRPFCIAAHTDCGKLKSQHEYYLSEMVQEAYGKCFTIEILGMVVTKSEVLLIVAMSDEMKALAMKFEHPKRAIRDVDDTLSNALSNLNVRGSQSEPKTKNKFDLVLSSSDTTTELIEWDDDSIAEQSINILCTSLIRIGESENPNNLFSSPEELSKDLFSPFINKNGFIEEVNYREFRDGTKYIRLPEDNWFMRLPCKISVDSFFSSLHSV